MVRFLVFSESLLLTPLAHADIFLSPMCEPATSIPYVLLLNTLVGVHTYQTHGLILRELYTSPFRLLSPLDLHI